MLYLGLVLGIVAGNYAANLAGLNSAGVFTATLLLLVPALVGARLLYVASHWETYRREPARIWRRSEGGAAVYGGLPFSLLASVPLLRLLQLPFGAFWDVATFTILTGMVFTRFGCLLNGCCAGRPTEGWLALYLPDQQGVWKRRIPTQLLEAGWAWLLLLGAIVLWSRLPFPGALFLFCLAGYGVGRLLLESTREEQDRMGGLTIHHFISVALVVLSVVIFIGVWRR
jgi:phosphatidylglycerol:prolipoprotein diacylglycerol transferase